MKINTFYKKYENILLSASAIFLYISFIFLRYDPIYELNDDTMIRNLLSGDYTGTPTPMNNQMMYIFSAALSFLYKIIPSVQWFDLFLIACQCVCLWSVLYVLIGYCNKTLYKIAILISGCLFSVTFLLNHFVLITYTVTSGMLAVTSIFLFVTDKHRVSVQSWIAIFFAVLSFCMRSELCLMLIPFICLAGVYCWSTEKTVFTTDNFKKYFGIFGVLLGCLGVVFFTDKLAYSSEEWQNFRTLFDARTTVYDYTDIPLYHLNEDFYNEEDISKQQYLLFRSYNYALDDDIDHEMMSTVADYAKRTGVDLREKVNIALGAYRIQVTDKIGSTYHTLTIVGYIMLLLCITRNNKFRIIISAGIVFFVRSIIWMYLWGQGRIEYRITHPLYWGEFLLLLAIYITENRKKTGNNVKKNALIICITIILSVVFCVPEISAFNERYSDLLLKAEQNYAVHKYCNEKGSNFYMMPTYSAGVLPEKIFDDCETPLNLELLGGWYAKSPEYYEKLGNNSIEKVDDSILNGDVYLIQQKDYVSYDTAIPFEWLTEYYKSKGYNVEVVKIDTIVDDIEVYKIEQLN